MSLDYCGLREASAPFDLDTPPAPAALCPTTTLFIKEDALVILGISAVEYFGLRRSGLLRASGRLPGRSSTTLTLHNFFDFVDCQAYRTSLSTETSLLCERFASFVELFGCIEPWDRTDRLATFLSRGQPAGGIKAFVQSTMAILDRTCALLQSESGCIISGRGLVQTGNI
jgi:hypothetical protein